MYKRLKVKLYPTHKQIEMLENHFDAFRYCYNLCLDYRQTLWNHHRINISGYDMAKELLQLRKEVEWFSKCKAECVREAAYRVEESYKNFFKGKGFPKFKSRRGVQSFHAYQSIHTKGNRLSFYSNKIKFNTSQEYEEFLEISKIKQITFKKDLLGDYWATLLIEDKTDLILPKNNNSVGIDLGLKHLYITSDREYAENNKYLEKEYYNLRKLQRKFAKTKKGGKNREILRKNIAKKHRKIKWQKEHHYHQLTNKLIRENQTICVESLGIKGMIENKELSRQITEASWGLFIQMLEYKCNWYGRELIKINQYYPSSKTCSNCGHVKEELKLSQRQYKCTKCSVSLDRDYNASLNILKEGLKIRRNLKTGLKIPEVA